MQRSLKNLFQSKFTRGALLLTLLAAVGASIAMSDGPEARIKLGGTWVGRLGDITWTGTYAPDPSGQNAVVTLQWMTVSVEFEAMLGAIGAQEMSMVSGSIRMTSGNTASGKLTWYILASGTASATQPVAGAVKAIAVMTSDWHFTSQSTAEGTHNIKMYFPNANGSMLPEDGQLFYDVTFGGVPHQKIN